MTRSVVMSCKATVSSLWVAVPTGPAGPWVKTYWVTSVPIGVLIVTSQSPIMLT
ncbi:Uncharacterised protein [Mycobacterium tuberculosis]|nr:Uncharacterised protein [Mycobacterium tuberculosis]